MMPEPPGPPGTHRFEVMACDVQDGDWIMEVFCGTGNGVAFFTHCHGKTVEKRVVSIVDCDGDDHLYPVHKLLVVWRRPG